MPLLAGNMFNKSNRNSKRQWGQNLCPYQHCTIMAKYSCSRTTSTELIQRASKAQCWATDRWGRSPSGRTGGLFADRAHWWATADYEGATRTHGTTGRSEITLLSNIRDIRNQPEAGRMYIQTPPSSIPQNQKVISDEQTATSGPGGEMVSVSAII